MAMSDQGLASSSNNVFTKSQEFFYDQLDKLWPSLASKRSVSMCAVILCLCALALNGNWMFIWFCLSKQMGFQSVTDYHNYFVVVQEVSYYVIWSILPGLAIYLPMCGFIHWFFYLNRKDRSDEWKCQPRKFLAWKDEKHEMILGTTMLTLVSTFSGFINYYIAKGGYCTLYYQIQDYGWTYYLLSIPVLFLLIDLSLYYAHRFMHLPVVYRNVHKMHHRYKQPTPFSATAMHPLEATLYQICSFTPMFVFPIHWSIMVVNFVYMFYYSIIDHSGVKMDAIWPWQPSSTFHDNHHQYFHVNFGFNMSFWDKLHGTYRIKGKVYNEKIFYGYGKHATEATPEEIKEYMTN